MVRPKPLATYSKANTMAPGQKYTSYIQKWAENLHFVTGGTFGSANIHSPRYVRSCDESITTAIHHPYLKIYRLGSAKAISYLFEGQQNDTRAKSIRSFSLEENVCHYGRFSAGSHRSLSLAIFGIPIKILLKTDY